MGNTTPFTPPDEQALLRLLESDDTAALIVCLAWRAGLKREEIRTLTGAQVDLGARLLRLPDRGVPLDDGLAARLLRRQDLGDADEYVVFSERHGGIVARQWISLLSRRALDGAGLRGVDLGALRMDYIRRALLKHDWPYVLRVSGLTVENYRTSIALRLGHPAPAPAKEPPAGPADGLSPEYSLWRLMQDTKDTPAGIALWLLHQLGLTVEEIVRLTWSDVDFDAGLIRVSGREEAMPRGVRRVLAQERERRADGDDPHVILSPATRRPLTAGRLSVVLRTALIRGGLDGFTPVDIRRGLTREVERSLILDHVSKMGSVSGTEAAKLLDLPDGKARVRLTALVREGKLVRVGNRWYDAGETVPPGRHEEIILAYAAEHGGIVCQEAAELLGLPPRHAGRVLARLVERGKLVLPRKTHRYVLPQ